MKKLIFLLGLLLLSVGAFSQSAGCNCSSSEDYLEYLYNGLVGAEYRNSAEGYKGNQYYGPWEKGRIVLSSGQTLTGINLRYDLFINKLLWVREKDFKTGILPISDVVSFTVPDRKYKSEVTFVRKKIRLPYQPDSTELYLRLLAAGEISFLSCHQAVESPSEYELVDETHYVAFSNNTYVYTGLRKRLLLKIPYIDRERMKAILKSNRIRVRNNEMQMARAFTLYNQAKTN
jgi:hypothetical protein